MNGQQLSIFDAAPPARKKRPLPEKPRFNGAAYERERDDARLTGQLLRIWDVMHDSVWRSLHQIATKTGDPEASISAQLRHLRKERFGGHKVERRHQGNGLYEYRLIPNLKGEK